MRRVPVAEVVTHEHATALRVTGLLQGLSGELVWAPTVDGHLIPGQPNAARAAVPILVGTNQHEGDFFAGTLRITLPFTPREVPRLEYEAAPHLLFGGQTARRLEGEARYAPAAGDNTRTLARLLTDYVFTCATRHVMNNARLAVFGYQFSHAPGYDVWPGVPLCAPGQHHVCHGFELPFVFGNPVTVLMDTAPPPPGIRFAPADQPVSDLMMGYWTRFATTLDPNHAEAPPWPPYRREAPDWLVFRSGAAPASDLDASCALWDGMGHQPEGLFTRLLQSPPD